MIISTGHYIQFLCLFPNYLSAVCLDILFSWEKSVFCPKFIDLYLISLLQSNHLFYCSCITDTSKSRNGTTKSRRISTAEGSLEKQWYLEDTNPSEDNMCIPHYLRLLGRTTSRIPLFIPVMDEW